MGFASIDDQPLSPSDDPQTFVRDVPAVEILSPLFIVPIVEIFGDLKGEEECMSPDRIRDEHVQVLADFGGGGVFSYIDRFRTSFFCYFGVIGDFPHPITRLVDIPSFLKSI
jgi:hypothetical protein